MPTTIDTLSSWDIMHFFGCRAAISILAGFIIGIERTLSNHAAGLKTLVMVSLGSCLFSSLAFYLHLSFPNSDPTRILGQVVTGVGFLGAGVIFFNQNKLSGLTSSAMIWVACSLGMMAGSGLYLVPLCGAVTIVIIIWALRLIERYVEKYFDDNDETNN